MKRLLLAGALLTTLFASTAEATRIRDISGIRGVRVSPHTLRHTCATQYIRNGGDPFSLQQILGHSTLEMVRNYVNLASRDVYDAHRRFSPMDRLLSSPG